MRRRWISLWFPSLVTDWQTLRRPELSAHPFVFSASDRGKRVITAANPKARELGIVPGLATADAKALVPGLVVLDERPALPGKLIRAIGEWCIRFTPVVAPDAPDGLLLDVSGCAHLWGGEGPYLAEITNRLLTKGYGVRAGMADTIGTAWALARFGKQMRHILDSPPAEVLFALPPAALRLEPATLARLNKLGFTTIGSFIRLPRRVLRRRFGEHLLLRADQALGNEDEIVIPMHVPAPYTERLPCLEPVRTAAAIEMAVTRLLEALCLRLEHENKGLRRALLSCCRVDGVTLTLGIGTSRAAHQVTHLLSLFRLQLPSLQPDLGIELFVLEAQKVEDLPLAQEMLWNNKGGSLQDPAVHELVDRLAGKMGNPAIRRYLPDAHHWPERSIKLASSLLEAPSVAWKDTQQRPIHLFPVPQPIEVSAPVPDYPPLLFRFRNEVHHVRKADGPERIEQEWWLQDGEHRDYYRVEDEHGARYWLFRLGHYGGIPAQQWFIHGFFA